MWSLGDDPGLKTIPGLNVFGVDVCMGFLPFDITVHTLSFQDVP